MKKEKQHILVTGGAGFIGTNLCKKLLGLGYKVTCVDNLITGKYENVTPFTTNKNYHFIKYDITDNIKDILPSDISLIINLACPASPKAYYEHPIETLMSSVQGVKNLLDVARLLDIPLIHSSTSEVYGDPSFDELNETYNGNVSCVGTRACYDEGKRAAETLCMDYRRLYKLNIKVIRIFNTYGPYMQTNDGRAIPSFIYSVLNHIPITIHGDGSQTRSFQYIDDLLEAIMLLMEDSVKYDYPINIGNPYEEMTINELANTINQLVENPSIINHVQRLEDDPHKRRPNIERAKDLLGWSPKITLEDGLLKTMEYFKGLC